MRFEGSDVDDLMMLPLAGDGELGRARGEPRLREKKGEIKDA
jgi:hypothetical protein